MAIMELSKRMVYWAVAIENGFVQWDITSMIGHYVSSIKVKDGISVTKKKGKKESAPSEMEMSITSKNYVENLFTEGSKIKVYMGYDRLFKPLVFQGTIKMLPDGSAREMIDYTVRAYSDEIVMSGKEKNYSFNGRTKSMIITEIAARNGYEALPIIKKDTIQKAGFTKIQKGMTDTEFLDKLCKEWDCSWWVKEGTIFFVDSDEIYSFGDILGSPLGLPYSLGYRTDRVKCNVETVSWSHSPSPGGNEVESMIQAFNEFGKDPAGSQYKLVYKGQTWKLKWPYQEQVRTNPLIFKDYALYSAGQTIALNAEQVLHEFFIIDPSDPTNSNTNIPSVGDDSGVELTIHLNEGDPELKPPRTARLYSGVLNPKVDNAHLPDWMFRYGIQNESYAKLNIKETVLTYSDGMLKSELKCGIGLNRI